MLFKSTTANIIDSEHIRDYKKLFLVCKVEILPVTVNKTLVLSFFFRLISDDFWLKMPKIAKMVPWFLADVHRRTHFQ